MDDTHRLLALEDREIHMQVWELHLEPAHATDNVRGHSTDALVFCAILVTRAAVVDSVRLAKTRTRASIPG